MASPNLGVRVPLFDLAPGMAGRRSGMGDEPCAGTEVERANGGG
jgi:hypothetical protein